MKEIYEAKYPEAKYDSSERMRAVRHGEKISLCQQSFATDTAAKLGVSSRTIQQEAHTKKVVSLACYTQEEIAEAVGVSHQEVSREILHQTENLPESAKAAANHLVDFEPPGLLHPGRGCGSGGV